MKINKNRLIKIIKKFSQVKVLVIGDVMLDQFIWGKVDRISPEAPVPVVEVRSESFMPGGAANVSINLKSLNVTTNIIGIIGDDLNGKVLKEKLRKSKIPLKGLVTLKKRTTTKKTRIIAHNQQVVRVDREDRIKLSAQDEKKFITKIKKIIPSYDAVILEDYGKGAITQNIINNVVKLAKQLKIYSSIDPKKGHDLSYEGIDLSTPNTEEAFYLGKINIKNFSSPQKHGDSLRSKLGLNHLLITLGEDGMALFTKDNKPYYIPTKAREVFDVSGAGDTVISVFTTAIAAKATPFEAAYIANIAAGIVVAKLGTATVTQKEILQVMA